MDFRNKIIRAPLIWVNGKFEPGFSIRISENGKITEVGKTVIQSGSDQLVELPDLALVPGFVNAHSHSFHRYLRGSSGIGQSSADTFWKWRDEMYKLVENITYEEFKKFCKGSFDEMLSAGITSVGEFHYVHHDEHRFDLDAAVVDAAKESGIRLVLINTFFSRASFFNEELNLAQRRFYSNINEFISQMDQLTNIIEGKNSEFVSLAIAAHSFRAVSLEGIKQLLTYSKSKSLPFHIHIEEQPKEIEDCMKVEGRAPLDLLTHELEKMNNRGDETFTEGFPVTAVHCTFSRKEIVEKFSTKNSLVCICPCTEGFLGDGIPNLTENERICLGTDCNNRICMLEEMRWLSFCQNMKNNSRNSYGINANNLMEQATKNGAISLGVWNKTGSFEIGKFMDFVGFDLQSKRLKEFSDDEKLLDAIVYGCDNSEVKITGVCGIVKFSK